MTKKIMAMVLCIVMVMSTFAMTAFAGPNSEKVGKKDTHTLKFDLVKKDKNLANENEFNNRSVAEGEVIMAGTPELKTLNSHTAFIGWSVNKRDNIVFEKDNSPSNVYVGANEKFTMTGDAKLTARWGQVDITRTGKLNADETVTYTVTITNKGDVNLKDIKVTDVAAANAITAPTMPDATTVLKPDDTFTYSYTVNADSLPFADNEDVATDVTVTCMANDDKLEKKAEHVFEDKIDLSLTVYSDAARTAALTVDSIVGTTRHYDDGLEIGDTIYYTAELINPSGKKFNNITVELPGGAENISVNLKNKEYDLDGTTLTINAGKVKLKENERKVVITFEVKITESNVNDQGKVINKVRAERKAWSELITVKTKVAGVETGEEDEEEGEEEGEEQPQPAPALLQMNASAENVVATFDGTPRSIEVIATNAAGNTLFNTSVVYSDSETGIFTEEAPAFTESGEYTVYYRVSGTGYYTQSGSATVTINPRQVTAAVATVNSVYGEELPETFEIVYGGDEILEGDELGVTATLTDILITSADLYEGVIQVDYDGANANYEVSTTHGNVNVTPASATINIANAGKIVDDEEPAFSATVSGTVGTDELDYTLVRESGEEVGTYEITATLGQNPNYDITVNEGTFTISAAVAGTQDEPEQGDAQPISAGGTNEQPVTQIPEQQLPAAGIGETEDETVVIEDAQLPQSGIETQEAPVQSGMDWTLLYILLGVAVLGAVAFIIAKKKSISR